MDYITLSFGQIIGAVIGAAAAIGVIATAWKVLSPVLKLEERVKELETNQNKSYETSTGIKNSIDGMRQANRLLVRAMVAVVDNRLTDNNVEGLKETKKELMEFLQEN